MQNKQTAIDWFFDKIKSHFEQDGDLFESIAFSYSIAKMKERQQIIYAYIVADSESAQQSEHHALNYYNRTYGSKGIDAHNEQYLEMVSEPKDDCYKCDFCGKEVKKFMAYDLWAIIDGKNKCFSCHGGKYR